jgi:hypothetical protein
VRIVNHLEAQAELSLLRRHGQQDAFGGGPLLLGCIQALHNRCREKIPGLSSNWEKSRSVMMAFISAAV